MRRAAAILLLASAPACAEEGRWGFRQGAVWTYEAETVLEWSVTSKSAGPRSAVVLRQRQVETVTLRLEVASVDPEGNASITGTVTSVRVENGVASGNASWDSTKSRTTEFLGFKRYEALLAAAFTAVVSPDGRILEAKNAGTPDPAKTPATAKENEEIPAFAMHVPTAPRTWLELVFRPVPPSKKSDARTIRFLEEEQLTLSFARNEKLLGRQCARLEFETPDREHSIDPKDVFANEHSDANALAWAAVRLAHKKGEAWFARSPGLLVKLEAESDATVGWGDKSLSARMTWKVELNKSE